MAYPQHRQLADEICLELLELEKRLCYQDNPSPKEDHAQYNQSYPAAMSPDQPSYQDDSRSSENLTSDISAYMPSGSRHVNPESRRDDRISRKRSPSPNDRSHSRSPATKHRRRSRDRSSHKKSTSRRRSRSANREERHRTSTSSVAIKHHHHHRPPVEYRRSERELHSRSRRDSRDRDYHRSGERRRDRSPLPRRRRSHSGSPSSRHSSRNGPDYLHQLRASEKEILATITSVDTQIASYYSVPHYHLDPAVAAAISHLQAQSYAERDRLTYVQSQIQQEMAKSSTSPATPPAHSYSYSPSMTSVSYSVPVAYPPSPYSHVAPPVMPATAYASPQPPPLMALSIPRYSRYPAATDTSPSTRLPHRSVGTVKKWRRIDSRSYHAALKERSVYRSKVFDVAMQRSIDVVLYEPRKLSVCIREGFGSSKSPMNIDNIREYRRILENLRLAYSAEGADPEDPNISFWEAMLAYENYAKKLWHLRTIQDAKNTLITELEKWVEERIPFCIEKLISILKSESVQGVIKNHHLKASKEWSKSSLLDATLELLDLSSGMVQPKEMLRAVGSESSRSQPWSDYDPEVLELFKDCHRYCSVVVTDIWKFLVRFLLDLADDKNSIVKSFPAVKEDTEEEAKSVRRQQDDLKCVQKAIDALIGGVHDREILRKIEHAVSPSDLLVLYTSISALAYDGCLMSMESQRINHAAENFHRCHRRLDLLSQYNCVPDFGIQLDMMSMRADLENKLVHSETILKFPPRCAFPQQQWGVIDSYGIALTAFDVIEKLKCLLTFPRFPFVFDILRWLWEREAHCIAVLASSLETCEVTKITEALGKVQMSLILVTDHFSQLLEVASSEDSTSGTSPAISNVSTSLTSLSNSINELSDCMYEENMLQNKAERINEMFPKIKLPDYSTKTRSLSSADRAKSVPIFRITYITNRAVHGKISREIRCLMSADLDNSNTTAERTVQNAILVRHLRHALMSRQLVTASEFVELLREMRMDLEMIKTKAIPLSFLLSTYLEKGLEMRLDSLWPKPVESAPDLSIHADIPAASKARILLLLHVAGAASSRLRLVSFSATSPLNETLKQIELARILTYRKELELLWTQVPDTPENQWLLDMKEEGHFDNTKRLLKMNPRLNADDSDSAETDFQLEVERSKLCPGNWKPEDKDISLPQLFCIVADSANKLWALAKLTDFPDVEEFVRFHKEYLIACIKKIGVRKFNDPTFNALWKSLEKAVEDLGTTTEEITSFGATVPFRVRMLLLSIWVYSQEMASFYVDGYLQQKMKKNANGGKSQFRINEFLVSVTPELASQMIVEISKHLLSLPSDTSFESEQSPGLQETRMERDVCDTLIRALKEKVFGIPVYVNNSRKFENSPSSVVGELHELLRNVRSLVTKLNEELALKTRTNKTIVSIQSAVERLKSLINILEEQPFLQHVGQTCAEVFADLEKRWLQLVEFQKPEHFSESQYEFEFGIRKKWFDTVVDKYLSILKELEWLMVDISDEVNSSAVEILLLDYCEVRDSLNWIVDCVDVASQPDKVDESPVKSLSKESHSVNEEMENEQGNDREDRKEESPSEERGIKVKQEIEEQSENEELEIKMKQKHEEKSENVELGIQIKQENEEDQEMDDKMEMEKEQEINEQDVCDEIADVEKQIAKLQSRKKRTTDSKLKRSIDQGIKALQETLGDLQRLSKM